eukprot:gnl/Dysnectes_brevis/5015_a7022_457.p1 GENE.gnl/Dysnectes_brevis/5015_a7022_457~~gnl/Dysnectes_brevis/5015_a7022_457.p1  ORF type:complete len:860 (+),score=162.77 gnl/Dysnectes_brevis/5015_a7022_457:34-2580(+)
MPRFHLSREHDSLHQKLASSPDSLDLKFQTIANDDLVMLVKAMTSSNTLKHLDLWNTDIEDISMFIEALSMSSLVSLDFGSNSIDDDLAIDIFNAVLQGPSATLRHFSIARNMLSDRSIDALTTLISQCPRLTTLDLRNNRIGDTGATLLADILPSSSLSRLSLQQNLISAKGARHISGSMNSSRRNITVDLRGNRINPIPHKPRLGRLLVDTAMSTAKASKLTAPPANSQIPRGPMPKPRHMGPQDTSAYSTQPRASSVSLDARSLRVPQAPIAPAPQPRRVPAVTAVPVATVSRSPPRRAKPYQDASRGSILSGERQRQRPRPSPFSVPGIVPAARLSEPGTSSKSSIRSTRASVVVPRNQIREFSRSPSHHTVRSQHGVRPRHGVRSQQSVVIERPSTVSPSTQLVAISPEDSTVSSGNTVVKQQLGSGLDESVKALKRSISMLKSRNTNMSALSASSLRTDVSVSTGLFGRNSGSIHVSELSDSPVVDQQQTPIVPEQVAVSEPPQPEPTPVVDRSNSIVALQEAESRVAAMLAEAECRLSEVVEREEEVRDAKKQLETLQDSLLTLISEVLPTKPSSLESSVHDLRVYLDDTTAQIKSANDNIYAAQMELVSQAKRVADREAAFENVPTVEELEQREGELAASVQSLSEQDRDMQARTEQLRQVADGLMQEQSSLEQRKQAFSEALDALNGRIIAIEAAESEWAESRLAVGSLLGLDSDTASHLRPLTMVQLVEDWMKRVEADADAAVTEAAAASVPSDVAEVKPVVTVTRQVVSTVQRTVNGVVSDPVVVVQPPSVDVVSPHIQSPLPSDYTLIEDVESLSNEEEDAGEGLEAVGDSLVSVE